MEDKLQIFNNPDFGEIRTTFSKEGEPLFCLADVCESLKLIPSKVSQRLGDGVLSKYPISDNLGRQQLANFINEDGLYDVILDSRKPQAKKFRKWVTSEVLPSIRKSGMYVTREAAEKILSDPGFLIQTLQTLQLERAEKEKAQKALAESRMEVESQALLIEAQEVTISEMEPKANYYDQILASPDSLTTSQIAKDYGKSAVWFNKLLSDMGIQHKSNGQWLLSAKYASEGYTVSVTRTYQRLDGLPAARMQTQWTQKGRLFLYRLLKAKDILPIAEIERNNPGLPGLSDFSDFRPETSF